MPIDIFDSVNAKILNKVIGDVASAAGINAPDLPSAKVVEVDLNNFLFKKTNKTFSVVLLNYVDPYEVAGIKYTMFYTEVNHNLQVGNKVFIIGGSYDSDDLIKINKFNKLATGYTVLFVDRTKVVLDIEYTGAIPANTDNIDNYIKVYVANNQEEFEYFIQTLSSRDFSYVSNRFTSFYDPLYGGTYSNNNILYINGTYNLPNTGKYGIYGFTNSGSFSSTYSNSFLMLDGYRTGYLKDVTSAVLNNNIPTSYKKTNNSTLTIINSNFTKSGIVFKRGVMYFYDKVSKSWSDNKRSVGAIITEQNFRDGIFKQGTFEQGLLGTHDKILNFNGSKLTFNLGTIINLIWQDGEIGLGIGTYESYNTTLDSFGLPSIKRIGANNDSLGYNFVYNSTIEKATILNGSFYNLNLGTFSFNISLGTFSSESVIEKYLNSENFTYSVILEGGNYLNSEIQTALIKNSNIYSSKVSNSMFEKSKSINSEIERSVFLESKFISDRITKIIDYDERYVTLYDDKNKPILSKLYKFYISEDFFKRIKEFKNFYFNGLKINSTDVDVLNIFDEKFSIHHYNYTFDSATGKQYRKMLVQISSPEDNLKILTGTSDEIVVNTKTFSSIDVMVSFTKADNFDYNSELGKFPKGPYFFDITPFTTFIGWNGTFSNLLVLNTSVGSYTFSNATSSQSLYDNLKTNKLGSWTYSGVSFSATSSQVEFISLGLINHLDNSIDIKSQRLEFYDDVVYNDVIDISNAYIIDSDFKSGLFKNSDWISGNYINYNADYSFETKVNSEYYTTNSLKNSDNTIKFQSIDKKSRPDILEKGDIVFVNSIYYDTKNYNSPVGPFYYNISEVEKSILWNKTTPTFDFELKFDKFNTINGSGFTNSISLYNQLVNKTSGTWTYSGSTFSVDPSINLGGISFQPGYSDLKIWVPGNLGSEITIKPFRNKIQGQNLVKLPDTYKINNKSSNSQKRTFELKDLVSGTFSIISKLPNASNFIRTPFAQNGYNYLHPVKFENSRLHAGIFRRAYLSNCVLDNSFFNNNIKNPTNYENWRSFLFSDIIFSDNNNTIKSGLFMNSHFISGSDVWENGIFYNSVWNVQSFTWSHSATGSDIYSTPINKFKSGIVRESTWLFGYFENGLFYNNQSNKTFDKDVFTNLKDAYYINKKSYNGTNLAKTRYSWQNGFFENGTFELSTFENGTFRRGNFFNSTFLAGTAVGGNFGRPTLKFSNTRVGSGSFSNVNVVNAEFRAENPEGQNIGNHQILWYSGVFNNGLFGVKVDSYSYSISGLSYSYGSTWFNGIFNRGSFTDIAVWKDGTFNNGQFSSYYGYPFVDTFDYPNSTIDKFAWQGGTFKGGIFGNANLATNSTWYNGKFDGGIFNGRYWNYGQFSKGIFNGSIKRDSTVLDNISYIVSDYSDEYYGLWNDGEVKRSDNLSEKDIKIILEKNKPAVEIRNALWRGGTFAHSDAKFDNSVWIDGIFKRGLFYRSSFNPYVNLLENSKFVLSSSPPLYWGITFSDFDLNGKILGGNIDTLKIGNTKKLYFVGTSSVTKMIQTPGLEKGKQYTFRFEVEKNKDTQIRVGTWPYNLINRNFTGNNGYIIAATSNSNSTMPIVIGTTGSVGEIYFEAKTQQDRIYYIYPSILRVDCDYDFYFYTRDDNWGPTPYVGSLDLYQLIIKDGVMQNLVIENVSGTYSTPINTKNSSGVKVYSGTIRAKYEDFFIAYTSNQVTDKVKIQNIFVSENTTIVLDKDVTKKSTFSRQFVANGPDFAIEFVPKSTAETTGASFSKGETVILNMELVEGETGFNELDNCLWEDGTFEDSVFYFSKWKTGNWITGTAWGMIWEDGVANFMNAYNIYWGGGTWKNGNWDGAPFSVDDIYENGCYNQFGPIKPWPGGTATGDAIEYIRLDTNNRWFGVAGSYSLEKNDLFAAGFTGVPGNLEEPTTPTAQYPLEFLVYPEPITNPNPDPDAPVGETSSAIEGGFIDFSDTYPDPLFGLFGGSSSVTFRNGRGNLAANYNFLAEIQIQNGSYSTTFDDEWEEQQLNPANSNSLVYNWGYPFLKLKPNPGSLVDGGKYKVTVELGVVEFVDWHYSKNNFNFQFSLGRPGSVAGLGIMPEDYTTNTPSDRYTPTASNFFAGSLFPTQNSNAVNEPFISKIYQINTGNDKFTDHLGIEVSDFQITGVTGWVGYGGYVSEELTAKDDMNLYIHFNLFKVKTLIIRTALIEEESCNESRAVKDGFTSDILTNVAQYKKTQNDKFFPHLYINNAFTYSIDNTYEFIRGSTESIGDLTHLSFTQSVPDVNQFKFKMNLNTSFDPGTSKIDWAFLNPLDWVATLGTALLGGLAAGGGGVLFSVPVAILSFIEGGHRSGFVKTIVASGDDNKADNPFDSGAPGYKIPKLLGNTPSPDGSNLVGRYRGYFTWYIEHKRNLDFYDNPASISLYLYKFRPKSNFREVTGVTQLYQGNLEEHKCWAGLEWKACFKIFGKKFCPLPIPYFRCHDWRDNCGKGTGILCDSGSTNVDFEITDTASDFAIFVMYKLKNKLHYYVRSGYFEINDIKIFRTWDFTKSLQLYSNNDIFCNGEIIPYWQKTIFTQKGNWFERDQVSSYGFWLYALNNSTQITLLDIDAEDLEYYLEVDYEFVVEPSTLGPTIGKTMSAAVIFAFGYDGQVDDNPNPSVLTNKASNGGYYERVIHILDIGQLYANENKSLTLCGDLARDVNKTKFARYRFKYSKTIKLSGFLTDESKTFKLKKVVNRHLKLIILAAKIQKQSVVYDPIYNNATYSSFDITPQFNDLLLLPQNTLTSAECSTGKMVYMKFGNGTFTSGTASSISSIWENGIWNQGLRFDQWIIAFENLEKYEKNSKNSKPVSYGGVAQRFGTSDARAASIELFGIASQGVASLLDGVAIDNSTEIKYSTKYWIIKLTTLRTFFEYEKDTVNQFIFDMKYYFKKGDKVAVGNIVAIDINSERRLITEFFEVLDVDDKTLLLQVKLDTSIKLIERDSCDHFIYVSKNIWLFGVFLNGLYKGIWNNGIFRGGPYVTRMIDSQWIKGRFEGGTFKSRKTQSYLSEVPIFTEPILKKEFYVGMSSKGLTGSGTQSVGQTASGTQSIILLSKKKRHISLLSDKFIDADLTYDNANQKYEINPKIVDFGTFRLPFYNESYPLFNDNYDVFKPKTSSYVAPDDYHPGVFTCEFDINFLFSANLYEDVSGTTSFYEYATFSVPDTLNPSYTSGPIGKEIQWINSDQEPINSICFKRSYDPEIGPTATTSPKGYIIPIVSGNLEGQSKPLAFTNSHIPDIEWYNIPGPIGNTIKIPPFPLPSVSWEFPYFYPVYPGPKRVKGKIETQIVQTLYPGEEVWVEIKLGNTNLQIRTQYGNNPLSKGGTFSFQPETFKIDYGTNLPIGLILATFSTENRFYFKQNEITEQEPAAVKNIICDKNSGLVQYFLFDDKNVGKFSSKSLRNFLRYQSWMDVNYFRSSMVNIYRDSITYDGNLKTTSALINLNGFPTNDVMTSRSTFKNSYNDLTKVYSLGYKNLILEEYVDNPKFNYPISSEGNLNYLGTEYDKISATYSVEATSIVPGLFQFVGQNKWRPLTLLPEGLSFSANLTEEFPDTLFVESKSKGLTLLENLDTLNIPKFSYSKIEFEMNLELKPVNPLEARRKYIFRAEKINFSSAFPYFLNKSNSKYFEKSDRYEVVQQQVKPISHANFEREYKFEYFYGKPSLQMLMGGFIPYYDIWRNPIYTKKDGKIVGIAGYEYGVLVQPGHRLVLTQAIFLTKQNKDGYSKIENVWKIKNIISAPIDQINGKDRNAPDPFTEMLILEGLNGVAANFSDYTPSTMGENGGSIILLNNWKINFKSIQMSEMDSIPFFEYATENRIFSDIFCPKDVKLLPEQIVDDLSDPEEIPIVVVDAVEIDLPICETCEDPIKDDKLREGEPVRKAKEGAIFSATGRTSAEKDNYYIFSQNLIKDSNFKIELTQGVTFFAYESGNYRILLEGEALLERVPNTTVYNVLSDTVQIELNYFQASGSQIPDKESFTAVSPAKPMAVLLLVKNKFSMEWNITAAQEDAFIIIVKDIANHVLVRMETITMNVFKS